MTWQIRASQKPIQAATVALFACAMAAQAQVPAFFNGQTSVGSGVYYLQFPDENLFGYYSYPGGSWIYHQDMGYEYYEDQGSGAIYFYDNATTVWFYTTASEFPYLQVLSGPLSGDTLWYYLDPSNPQHYTSAPRYFYDIPTCNTTPCPAGQVIQLNSSGDAIGPSPPTTPNSLSINGGGNSATMPTNTAVTLALGYSDATPNSANDIWSGKVNLADASGNVWCPMTWQRTPGTTNPITVSVALDDVASGTQSDGFCTVTAVSGSYPGSPTTTSGPVNVTIMLSVTVAGTYTVQSAVYDMQGLESSLGQLGTLTTVAPDFTIGLSSPATTMAGGSATYTVTVTPVANSGFNGQVQLSAPGLPSNASASFSPATITGSGTSTMTVTAPGSAGNIAVVATGTSGSLTHNASSTLTVQDFSVAMSPTYPSPVTVAPGGQAAWTILTSGLNGFGQQGQTIGLSFSPASIGNLPACAGLGNVTWSAYSVTPGQTDALTLTAGPSNQYWCTFEVTASYGSLHHVLNGYLVQQGTGGFVLSQPAQQTVAPGQTANFAAPYTPYAGFTGSVAYSVSGNVPSGATTSFTALASPALGDALSVYVPPGVLAGTYVLQITATGPSGCTPPALGSSNSCISQTAYTQLVVQSGEGFSITATPQTSTTVAPGGTAQYNISVNSTGGYTGYINLSLSGTPSAATATLSSYSVQAGGAAVTLTVATTANTPLSIYSIVVTGTNGSVSQYGAATLIVTLPSAASMLTPPPGANLAGGNTTFTWNAGLGATQYTVTATPTNGQTVSATTGPGQLSATLSLPAISQTASVTLQTMTANGALTQNYTYTIQPSGTPQGLTLAPGNAMPSVPANGQEVLYTFNYTPTSGARPSPQDLIDCLSTETAIRIRIVSLSAGTATIGGTATLGFTAPIGTPVAADQWTWGCDDGGGTDSGGSGTGSTGDPTPVIDSISPDPLPAGLQSLTISGENFGISTGELSIGGACPQAGDPSWLVPMGSASGSISVNVFVDPTTASYCTVVVGASVDEYGNSFIPGGGSSEDSDPFSIPVEEPASAGPIAQIQQGGLGGSVILPGTTVSVLIGQRNVLYGSLASAAGCTAASYTWTIPGNTASGWSNSTSVKTPAAGTTVPTVNFAWTDDHITTATVEFTVELSNCAYESATATAQFSISAPTLNAAPTTATNSVNVGQNAYVQSDKGQWGLYFNSSDGNTPGISFVVSPKTQGNYEWVQVINSNLIERFNLGTNQWESSSVIPSQGGPVLDGGVTPVSPITYSDSPDSIFGTCCSYWARADNFSTVLMFEPTARDVWVPLYQVNWFWQGSAMLTGNTWAPWTAPAPAWAQNPSFSRTYAYPSWTQIANPNAAQYTPEPAPAVASVAVSPGNVASGSSATVTVTLSSRAPADGASIALSSTNASLLNPGATMLIPANQLVGTVSVTAGPATGTATVTGSYSGSQASGSVTVTPPGQ